MATAALSPSLPADHPPLVAVSRTAAPALCISRILLRASLIIALLLVNKLGLAGNIVFFAVIASLVMLGKEWPLKALTLMVLGLICNQWYVPKSQLWTVARFGVPPVVLLWSFVDLGRYNLSLFRKSFYLWHILFIGVSAILTIMTGYMVHIALLKLVNYTIGTTAIFAQVAIQRARRCDLSEWFITLIVVVVILGVASMPLGIAYNAKAIDPTKPHIYFNGPFYHSNTLGPFAALICLYLACVYLFGAYRNRWICLGCIAALLYFMRLSQSRTAFAALVAGVIILVALTFVLRRRGWTFLRMNTRRPTIVAVIAVAVIGAIAADVATGGRLSKEAVGFINKSAKTEELNIDQVLSSRMGRIQVSWSNFQKSPLIGIGFELSTDEWFQQNASLFYAPIEKGFLPTAILEQSGIIGTIFFVGTLVAMLAYLRRAMNVPGMVMFLGFLVVNCGEVMYFGVAGHGAFGWLLVAAGMNLGEFAVYDVRRLPPRRGLLPS